MPNPLVSEATITSALRALRVRTIREGRPGREHVEALLALRGDNLAPVPKAYTIRFRRGELSRVIRRALAQGPLELRDVSGYVYSHKPAMGRRTAHQRVSVILFRMKTRGMVAHEGRLWRLAEQQRPHADHDKR
jgi:hypothetical protein